MSGLPTIEEALALVLARVRPLQAESVPTGAARGRVTAAPVRAVTDLPPFPSSAMDGYAVRAADTPGRLGITGRSAAGRPADVVVTAGTAVEISTGAVVPDGADSVVPVERVTVAGGSVTVEAVAKGGNVRPRGGDVRGGDVVVDAGTELTPSRLGAVAAAGVAELEVARRPRVAVLATGTELRPPGAELAPGQIYESNGLLLAAALETAGAEVTVLPAVGDEEEATRAALERGLGHDVLVTSGGVSVGPHDLVRAALAELGAEEVLWRVAVKPGKPFAFSVRGDTLVFGLPGNPVSSLVGFELFVRPALRALQGAREPGPRWLAGRLAGAVRRTPQRDELVRARVESGTAGVVLRPAQGQESHMIARAAAADALVLVRRGEGVVPEGATAAYLPL